MSQTLARETAPPTRVRDPFLDNARFGVMILVVVSHFMTDLQDVHLGRVVYSWAFLFHMPVFVLVSGYTARRYRGDARQVQRMLGSLVVPYLLVNVALNLTDRWESGDALSWALLDPNWLSWFLAALFVWRLSTPIWLALRHPVLVAVVVSLVGGLAAPDNVLEIKRVLGFLPFYVAGMYLTREHFEALTRTWVRVAAVVLLAGTFVASWLWSEGWTVSWLYFNDGYGELDAGPLDGMAVRAGLLALGFAMSLAALSLVPRRAAWYSSLGERTLYAYLLHGFVVIVLRQAGVFTDLQAYGTLAVVGVGLGAALLATALMTRPVSTLFAPVLAPQLRWLMRPSSRRAR
ncbi:acyltransferase family protein [Solicola sp. PLA-1-18]|uniref:acyltransferase family protein n=1 Tax=Solicola sp. PLA-1-18 TaxID=3380532 RepID=UPI003B78D886